MECRGNASVNYLSERTEMARTNLYLYTPNHKGKSRLIEASSGLQVAVLIAREIGTISKGGPGNVDSPAD
jgi:hypothetical protein